MRRDAFYGTVWRPTLIAVGLAARMPTCSTACGTGALPASSLPGHRPLSSLGTWATFPTRSTGSTPTGYRDDWELPTTLLDQILAGPSLDGAVRRGEAARPDSCDSFVTQTAHRASSTGQSPGHKPGDGESACKRGSVTALAALPVTIHLRGLPGGRPSRDGRAHPCPLLDLAPGGGCQAARVAPDAGALLPHRFTLACDRRTGPSAVCSLLPDPTGRPDPGSRQHLALWSPDFPRPGRCRAAATRPTHRRRQL